MHICSSGSHAVKGANTTITAVSTSSAQHTHFQGCGLKLIREILIYPRMHLGDNKQGSESASRSLSRQGSMQAHFIPRPQSVDYFFLIVSPHEFSVIEFITIIFISACH